MKILNKAFDKFLEVLLIVWEILLWSLFLPLILFVGALLGEIAHSIYSKLADNPYLWYGLMISVGIVLKFWRHKIIEQIKE